MTAAPVVQLHPEAAAVADQSLTAVTRYLDRCKLATNTVNAYRRQCASLIAWLAQHGADHPDAFTDLVGAEATVGHPHRAGRRRRRPRTFRGVSNALPSDLW